MQLSHGLVGQVHTYAQHAPGLVTQAFSLTKPLAARCWALAGKLALASVPVGHERQGEGDRP